MDEKIISNLYINDYRLASRNADYYLMNGIRIGLVGLFMIGISKVGSAYIESENPFGTFLDLGKKNEELKTLVKSIGTSLVAASILSSIKNVKTTNNLNCIKKI